MDDKIDQTAVETACQSLDVPNWFQCHLGVRHRVTISGEPDALTMLFRLQSNDGQPPREPGQFLSRIEFIESTGYVFRIGVSGYGSMAEIMDISEGPFPRRDPTLHMRLYEKETDRLLFDLHIPNPGYKPEFDEWKPEPVPATQTVEPLTVTLKHGLEDIPAEYPRDEDIEITSTDPRWTNTRPQRQHWTTDATGGKANGLTGLSPFELAWKLHVRVHRNEAAEFSPNEVWRTRLIRLPAPLTAERLNLRGMAGGYEFSTGYVCSTAFRRPGTQESMCRLKAVLQTSIRRLKAVLQTPIRRLKAVLQTPNRRLKAVLQTRCDESHSKSAAVR